MPDLIPRETDFIDEADTHVITTVTVKASPEEVWAVFTDNERWPEWFPAAKACRTTSEQAEGVGSTRWIHFDLFKVNERFVAWDAPHRWAFTILNANLPGLVSVVEQATLEPVGDGETKVTYDLSATLAPYMKPLTPALKWRLGKLFAKGLAGIERQVEKIRAANN